MTKTPVLCANNLGSTLDQNDDLVFSANNSSPLETNSVPDQSNERDWHDIEESTWMFDPDHQESNTIDPYDIEDDVWIFDTDSGSDTNDPYDIEQDLWVFNTDSHSDSFEQSDTDPTNLEESVSVSDAGSDSFDNSFDIQDVNWFFDYTIPYTDAQFTVVTDRLADFWMELHSKVLDVIYEVMDYDAAMWGVENTVFTSALEWRLWSDEANGTAQSRVRELMDEDSRDFNYNCLDQITYSTLNDIKLVDISIADDSIVMSEELRQLGNVLRESLCELNAVYDRAHINDANSSPFPNADLPVTPNEYLLSYDTLTNWQDFPFQDLLSYLV